MKINYIRAKNFLSIGNKSVEIDFTKYGNIIKIIGENRDQGPGASNGSGKSTLLEIMVYAFFGDLMKNLNHKKAINIKNKKGLETEVLFELKGHEYRIIRRRTPDRLELWEDGIDKSGGGIPATQEEINKIIGLNYTSFINVVCFGQHNNKQFLACPASDKRNIAENLLSLEKYNKYCKVAKDKAKDLEKKTEYLVGIYEKTVQDVLNGERQVKQIIKKQEEWRAAQLNGIEQLSQQIFRAKNELLKLSGSSTDVLSQLESVNTEIEQKQKQKNNLAKILAEAMEKINKLQEERQNVLLSSKEIQFSLKKIDKEISQTENHSKELMSKNGAICPVCYSQVDSSNFSHILEHNSEYALDLKKQTEEQLQVLQSLEKKSGKVEEFYQKLKNAYEETKAKDVLLGKSLRELMQKQTAINANFRENASSAALLVEQRISHLNEQMEDKRRELETNPMEPILLDAEKELEKARKKSAELKTEVDNFVELKPYYDFWIKAFGDNGIRSFIISETIPLLNARINYWLQFLVDNKIKLNFNTELEERIERNPPDGDPFVYNAMSGGEHQRIDLGIALAFAQVMMLTAGTSPSLICLDEVGTNLDRPGIQAVYNTICELAREKQVLVTTHDPDLLELLSGCDTIKVVKEDGYSRIEK